MEIDKKKLIVEVGKVLEQKLDVIASAAEDAKEAATHEDAKAENKYDTRSIESSYLAGAQAKRVEDLKETLFKLNKLELLAYKEGDQISATHLVETEVDGEETKWFFILPAEAGLKFEYQGMEILVVTPDSPLGRKFVNCKEGDDFTLKIKENITEYSIIRCI